LPHTMLSNKEQKNGAIVIEGHVQGLSNTRSLGESGIPVYVVDKTDCIARYSKYCTKFFRCPDFGTDDFATFLVDLAQKENIKDWVLIPSNDHAVYTISKHKAQLEKYYKVITPSLDIIENIYDKSKLLTISQGCGVPIPKTQYFTSVNDIIDNLTFPMLTKGRFGLTFYKTLGKKVFLADNEDELRAQLKVVDKKYDINKTFTQELIPFDGTNKTISFTAFCVNGEVKTHWTGVKLREHPIQFGTATFAKSIYCEECLRQSISLLKELNYTGVCEVEYLLDPRDGKYKLIEINARTWLWVGLAKACGVNYTKIIYDYVNNYKIDYPETYSVGKIWINPVTDTVFSLLGMLKGLVKPIDYFQTILKHGKANALFAKGDLRPGFAYFYKSFNFIKNR